MFFCQLRRGSSPMLGRDVLEEIQDFDRLHLFRCVCMLSQRLGVQDRNSHQIALLELSTKTWHLQELQRSTEAFEEEVQRRLANSSELVTLPTTQPLCFCVDASTCTRAEGLRRRRGQGAREAPGMEGSG